ncbi:MAG: hypothetical protein ACEQSR_03770 [Candidatus Methylacidiphilales bacterium]
MNKIAAIGLLTIALFLDLYLVKNGGAFIPNHLRENLAHWFNGSFLDWIGIIIYNATILFVASGLFGVWEDYEEVGSVAKTIAFGIGLAGGLGLIMLT